MVCPEDIEFNAKTQRRRDATQTGEPASIRFAQPTVGASWNHHQKRAETERGLCGAPAAAARRGHAFWGSFGDFGHPHLLRLVLRTQPRSGGGSKMRPPTASSRFLLSSEVPLIRLEPVAKVPVLHLCRKLCRSLGRKMPDPTKAHDKVFSSADFCNSL